MSPIDDCQRAVDGFRRVAQGVDDGDLDRRTPCSEWDVRTLLSHVVGIYDAATRALHGEKIDLGNASTPIGDDPPAQVDAAAERMMAAWREPGALDRTLSTTIRDMPAALGIRVVIGDSLLHGWDLASALGRPYEMPDDLAAAQFEMMQQFYDPAARGPDRGFDVAVNWPESAPVQERLVALSGRRPR
jgi:uncharacterized protein (TIGR03086 family)